MKQSCNWWMYFLSNHSVFAAMAALGLGIAVAGTRAEDKTQSPSTVTSTDVIGSLEAGGLEQCDKVAVQWTVERNRLSPRLLSMFQDAKAPTLQRCFAAYYLGEMRSPEAAGALAPEIALHINLSKYIIKHLPLIAGYPVADALVKIGGPAAPSVMENLKGSDDPAVTDLSLKVLYGIQRDKDVVQLRLTKAIESEQDVARKTRLRGVADKLREINVESLRLH
jgi:hypothetical protein